MGSCSSPRGVNSRNYAGGSHLVDLTRVFFRCLFDSLARNCGIAAMIRIFPAKVRRVHIFLNCRSESKANVARMSASPRSGAKIARATQIASGTLYPMLVRLEAAGWLISEWEATDPRVLGRPRRRFYKLTKLGQNLAKQELADLQINSAVPAWTT